MASACPPACQPGCLQHHRLPLAHAPQRAEPAEAVLDDLVAGEFGEIDTAIDHPDALPRHAMARGDEIGGIAGVGDHHIARAMTLL